ELRRIVARENGLDDEAARFLTGETLGELEQSAATLAQLIGERREEPEPEHEPTLDLFAGAALAKAQRKRALVGMLTGRAPQPRDERGRFAGGLDGGARRPVPTRRSPEQEHNRLVAELAAIGRTFRRGF